MALNEVDVLADIVEFLPKLLLFGAENLLLDGGQAAEIRFDFTAGKSATVEPDDIAELVDLDG